MKKLFTFVCAALLSAGMWADTAIISWQLGANGAELTKEDEANVLYHCKRTFEFFFNTIIAGFFN